MLYGVFGLGQPFFLDFESIRVGTFEYPPSIDMSKQNIRNRRSVVLAHFFHRIPSYDVYVFAVSNKTGRATARLPIPTTGKEVKSGGSWDISPSCYLLIYPCEI